MRYRSRIDIVSQILEVAYGGNATKTNIMYKAFLSYDQLKEQLAILTEKDLLRYDEDTRTFKTTEKGLRFLQIYHLIGDMIKEEDEEEQQQQQAWVQRNTRRLRKA
jgi:predicted transcriptional regulator